MPTFIVWTLTSTVWITVFSRLYTQGMIGKKVAFGFIGFWSLFGLFNLSMLIYTLIK